MTPAEIGAAAVVLETVGKWPVVALLAGVFLAPWFVMFWISRGQDKMQREIATTSEQKFTALVQMHKDSMSAYEEKFKAAIQMYKDNVGLVKSYEKLSNEQQDLTIMNTRAFTELSTIIKERL